MSRLELLDVFYFAFHSALVVFNLFGWIPRVTRKWNLATLVLTAGSWFGLGLMYGIGYCPLTEWHWRVRMELGKPDMPNSYIKFLLDSLTGLDWNATLVDAMTGISFFLAMAASIYVNVRDRRRKAA